VPILVPSLNLAKARQSERGKDALDHLDVHLSSSGLVVDESCGKVPEMFQGKHAMIGRQIQKVLERLLQVNGDVKIPTTGGASEAKQCQKGLESSRLNIEEVCRILKEGPGGLTVNGKSLASGVIDDAVNISGNQREVGRSLCCLSRRLHGRRVWIHVCAFKAV